MNIENLKITPWDERRNLLLAGDKNSTLDVCVRHFIASCRQAIETHGHFFVALSGGSTPKEIYSRLTQSPNSEQIAWEKVWLFWGDERSVPPEHPDNNYKMAMEAGFNKMPIPKSQIFRMKAEENIEQNALEYDQKLRSILQEGQFDLVILGMGEDGHTASLFPQTEGLKAKDRLAIANFIPQKNTWRMSLTFEAINQAHNIAIYAIGEAKKDTLFEVFNSPENFERYPVQKIGTKENKALWIIDDEASSKILKK